MRINFNFRPNRSFSKKFLILFLFSLFCFLIKSCDVKAWTSQVPDFLRGFEDFKMRCASGYGENGWSSDNCAFSGVSNDYYFAQYLPNDPKIKAFPYVLLLETGERSQDVVLYFSYVPLSLKCNKGSGNVDSCYVGRYKNGVWSTDVHLYRLNGQGSSGGNIFNVYENVQPNQIMANEVDGVYNLYNYIPIKEAIYANYDVYFVNDNSNIVSNYSYYDMGDYFDYSPPDDRSLLEKIVDGILFIPNTIISWGSRIFNAIGDLVSDIVNGIKSIFIPDQQMALDTLSSEYDYLHDRLGFLFYPIELITDFATRFYNIPNNSNVVFTIPDVSFMNHTLIHSTSINLSDIVNSSPIIISIYNIYLVVVSALVVIWVSQLAYQKFNETIGGSYK